MIKSFLLAMLQASKKPNQMNSTLFYTILCLFCGFEARESGFSSLIFYLSSSERVSGKNKELYEVAKIKHYHILQFLSSSLMIKDNTNRQY